VDDLAKSLNESITADSPALVNTQVGGYTLPITFVKSCNSCFYYKRGDMEKMIIWEMGYKTIAESLPSHPEMGRWWTAPSWRSISSHRKKHMGYEQYARKVISEQVLAERGIDPEQAAGIMLDSIGVLKTLRSYGWLKVAEGKIEVQDVGELLAVMKLEAQLEQMHRDDVDSSEAQNILEAYATEVARILDPAQREELNSFLSVNPVIRRAMGKPALDADSWEEDLVDEEDEVNALLP
jgi:hypothetical protein